MEQEEAELKDFGVPGIFYSHWKSYGKQYVLFTHARSGVPIMGKRQVTGIRKALTMAKEILPAVNWDIEWPADPDQKLFDAYYQCMTKLSNELGN